MSKKMEDTNKTILPQSSPKHPSSGNNENESENHWNLQQKNKNLMSPTISAASKISSSPKKKIFSEWKSPKSDLAAKMGNSNSGVRKSLPKIPSFSSPKSDLSGMGNSNSGIRNSLPKIPSFSCHKNNDEIADDVVVTDSFDVPYDPLTNYLSPRPRFRRYRPNLRQEIAVEREEKSDSDSLGESVETSEISTKEESGGIVICDEQSVIETEFGDVDDIEDGFDEENWGLKWVLFKGLIVFSALFFCTMWICSMNPNSVQSQELGGIAIVDERGMNISFRFVSLRTRSLDDRTWSLVGQNSSVFKSDEQLGGVDQTSESVVVQETEITEEMNSLDDSRTWVLDGIDGPVFESEEGLGRVGKTSESVEVQETEMLEKVNQMQARLWNVDYFEGIQIEVPNGLVEEIEVPDSKNEGDKVEIEAPTVVALELNEEPGIEDLVSSETKFNEVELESGVEIASKDSEAEFIGVDDSVELGSTLENATEDSDNATEKGIVVDCDKGMEVSEVKSNDHEGNQTGTLTINPGEDVIVNERLRLTVSERIWPVIAPLIAFSLLASLVTKFYRKCKKVSSKTRSSSNVRNLCSNNGKTKKIRPRLPPKAMEKTDQFQLNAADHLEVNPPLSINAQEKLERDLHLIIPRVKQVGEFEVGVEFTQSHRDENVFSTPDTKRVIRRSSVSGHAASIVQPSSSEVSTAESYSCGSYISQDRTSMNKNGRDEMNKGTPTPRRSTRLQNNGVTSP